MTKTRKAQPLAPRRVEREQPRQPLIAWHGPTILAAAALVAMTFAAYAPVFHDTFIWDDDAYVTRNPTLRSLDGLRQMWFVRRSIPQYYPLVHTTFWIEYHLWRLAPLGYHVVNVLLHSASVLLLWRLLLRLGVPGAWFAAAIFAVHPVEVESVAWITERKNVLSLALALLSMHCYFRFAPADEIAAEPGVKTTARSWWYVAALVLFIAALLSKTVVATLPAVLVVIYWWKRGAIPWRELPALAPLFLVGAGLGIHTAWLERIHVGAEGQEWSFTPLERLLIAGRAPWFYASKLAWPHPLIFFYRRWQIDEHIWWQYLFPAATLATIVVLWFARKRIGRGPLAAVLIFVGVLMPALGFFNVYPFRYSFVADHFQYHASLALIVLASGVAATVVKRLKPSDRRAAWFAAAVVLMALVAQTFRQAGVYEDLESLYRDTMAKNPRGWVAYSNLALYFDRQGRNEEAVDLARESVELAPHEPSVLNNMAAVLLDLGNRDGFKPGQLDEVISTLRSALAINPRHVQAYSNLGLALAFDDQPEESIKELSHALEIDPGNPRALYAMGTLSEQLGKVNEAQKYYEEALARDPDDPRTNHNLALILLQQGKTDEAIAHLRVAVRLNPHFAEAHYALAGALSQQGDREGAARHNAIAVQLRPTDVKVLVNMGIAQLNLGEADSAIQAFQQAIALEPQNVEAHFGLGIAYRVQGKPSEATEQFRIALELDPNRPETHYELATMFVGQNDLRQAVRYYTEAVRLRPDYFAALTNLGASLLQLGEIDQAVPHLSKALQLEPDNPQARGNLRRAQALKQQRPAK